MRRRWRRQQRRSLARVNRAPRITSNRLRARVSVWLAGWLCVALLLLVVSAAAACGKRVALTRILCVRARARACVLRVFLERASADTQTCHTLNTAVRAYSRARICEMCIIACVCVCVRRRGQSAFKPHAVRHSKTCFDVAQCAYNTHRRRMCTTRRMNSHASVLHIYVSTGARACGAHECPHAAHSEFGFVAARGFRVGLCVGVFLCPGRRFQCMCVCTRMYARLCNN